MKSPFPGMDPYIEHRGLWRDFQHDLITEIERGLAGRLPERYFIQLGVRSYVVLEGFNVQGSEAPTAVDPVTMRAFIEEHFREIFIEIYESDPDERLVTCIEILSPSNKRRGSEGWDQYLRKRNTLLLGSANLVEIDLLRGGQRMPMVEPWPKSPYYLLVGRQSRVPYCRVWSADYRQPLPEIPVPLASPDSDIPLALQPMVDAVYERSRYARRIDYAKPLDPPLPPDHVAWLASRPHGEEGSAKTPPA